MFIFNAARNAPVESVEQDMRIAFAPGPLFPSGYVPSRHLTATRNAPQEPSLPAKTTVQLDFPNDNYGDFEHALATACCRYPLLRTICENYSFARFPPTLGGIITAYDPDAVLDAIMSGNLPHIGNRLPVAVSPTHDAYDDIMLINIIRFSSRTLKSESARYVGE